MTRFRVSDGCTGLNMQDGTEYKAHNGYVEVDDPDHAKWVKKAQVSRDGFIDDRIRFTNAAPVPGCPSCGFSAWAWSKSCPRCGAALDALGLTPEAIAALAEPIVVPPSVSSIEEA